MMVIKFSLLRDKYRYAYDEKESEASGNVERKMEKKKTLNNFKMLNFIINF